MTTIRPTNVKIADSQYPIADSRASATMFIAAVCAPRMDI